MCLLILCGIVVALFTFSTCQCDSRTHDDSSNLFSGFLSIKKRPQSLLITITYPFISVNRNQANFCASALLFYKFLIINANTIVFVFSPW